MLAQGAITDKNSLDNILKGLYVGVCNQSDNMYEENTRDFLARKRKQQDRAEDNNDYKKISDIIKELNDFGLRDVYDR